MILLDKLTFFLLVPVVVDALLIPNLSLTKHKPSSVLGVAKDIERPPTFLDDENDLGDISITFVDEDDEDDEDFEFEFADDEEVRSEKKETSPGRKRWEALDPKIKQRLIEKGQAKAIANKRKREPAREEKRRMLMYYKEKQLERKRASRIQRPLGFHERAPLTAFSPGMEVTGVVISLTKYGVYVDVGTECDGLLHISQITRDYFVEHPRQVFKPGDEVVVKIRSTSPELKKLHLTMLNEDDDEENDEDDNAAESRITLQELELDDELWGEIKRVTDYGAYIEVGAVVDAFMHFMDHPLWDDGNHPSEFMKKGQRVRVWVADLDMEQKRIRVTANRPAHLPGPRLYDF